MTAQPAYQPEFSRLIAIEGIMPDKLRTEKVEATPAECAALAKRFDLRDLSGLSAELKIRRVAGGTAIHVEGTFEADVVQACVVSLQDVNEHISGHFETFFAEDGTEAFDDDLSLEDDEDAPEIVSNGILDMGEIVAQYLALDIPLYPRAPGVSLAAQLAVVGLGGKSNPFQVLETLKGEGDTPEKPSQSGKKGKTK